MYSCSSIKIKYSYQLIRTTIVYTFFNFARFVRIKKIFHVSVACAEIKYVTRDFRFNNNNVIINIMDILLSYKKKKKIYTKQRQ